MSRRRQEGFSLIELIIVLLIVSILLAVAIPTYLAARNRAENRAAQETLAHVLVSGQADYASQGAFVPLHGAPTLSAWLQSHDGAVKILGGGTTPATRPNEVSEEHGNQYFTIGAWSASGKCWFTLDIQSSSSAAISSAGVAGPGIYYGEAPTSSGGCSTYANVGGRGWFHSFAAASAA